MEVEAELDVDDETEDKQSTWVRVYAAPSPSNSHILHPPSPTLRSISAHLLHPPLPPPPTFCGPAPVQMCVVCSEIGRDSMGAVSSR